MTLYSDIGMTMLSRSPEAACADEGVDRLQTCREPLLVAVAARNRRSYDPRKIYR